MTNCPECRIMSYPECKECRHGINYHIDGRCTNEGCKCDWRLTPRSWKRIYVISSHQRIEVYYSSEAPDLMARLRYEVEKTRGDCTIAIETTLDEIERCI